VHWSPAVVARVPTAPSTCSFQGREPSPEGSLRFRRSVTDRWPEQPDTSATSPDGW
jgi:hypothetical protein